MENLSRLALTEKRAHAHRSYEAKAPEQSSINAKIVHQIAEHLKGRLIDNTQERNIEMPITGTSVEIWPVQNSNEKILIFRESRSYLYWESMEVSIEIAREHALHWLMQPPVALASTQ